MRFLPSIILTITLLVLSMGLFSEAEAKTVDAGHATVAWKGTGVIDDQRHDYRDHPRAASSRKIRTGTDS
jgi:hypothetical protein